MGLSIATQLIADPRDMRHRDGQGRPRAILSQYAVRSESPHSLAVSRIVYALRREPAGIRERQGFPAFLTRSGLVSILAVPRVAASLSLFPTAARPSGRAARFLSSSGGGGVGP